MALHDFDPLYEKYDDTVELMNSTFTSHEFILTLAHRNQREYIDALYAYRDSKDPFQIVHGVLAQRLLTCENRIRHLGGVASQDIFGHSNGCGQWEKVTA